MSSQTQSWFVEIKSHLATHRLFPFHQSRMFDSTAKIRTIQQLPTWVDCLCGNLHIWMNPSSRGLPEYCNCCTSMAFSEHRPSWNKASKSAADGGGSPRHCNGFSAFCAREWQSYGDARPSRIQFSALQMALLARTGEWHYHHYHHYSKGAYILSSSLLPTPFNLPPPPFPLTPCPAGFWRGMFFQVRVIT